MATPFQIFVNGELPKRPFTQDAAVSWTQGRVLVTTGVALGVTTEVFPAPPVTSVNSSTGAVEITADSLSAIPTSQKGAASGVASLDASGFVPMSQMNPGVVERLYVVTDETARFALTTSQVQNGDVVKQELPAPAAMYYVQDDTNLDSELGYAVFAVGTAAAVAWSGVTGIPQVLLDLENISGAITGDILQFNGLNWIKQSRDTYVTGLDLQTSDIEGLDTALGDKQVHDVTLDALSNLPDLGFIVQIAEDSFTSRELEAGDGINITYPNGVDGNPLIAFTEGPSEAEGTHGDENTYLGLEIDSHGRTTLVTQLRLRKDTVYIPNSTDSLTLEAKTLYMIGDYVTNTYGELNLQLPILTTEALIEIQVAFTVQSISQVNLTPNGVDLIFGQSASVDVNTVLPLLPGCVLRLFYHSVGVGWVGQANYSDHLKNPKIHPYNATNFGVGHTISSKATSGLNFTLPDTDIDLGDPITLLSFDRDTDVLTATRVDGAETTTLLDQDHMDKLFNPYGGYAGAPLEVGRTYRPAGSVAIYSPDTPVYLPLATADAFNSHESVPIRLMTGNSILNAGYLRLTPQVGETMYHSDINGSVVTSTYLPIPNNSEVTCYMIGVGEWYVDIRQDANYLDTDHFTLVDPTLRSKSVKFNVAPVGGAGSAQRTITVPDADVSLGKVPTGVTPTYATGRLMVPLADGTSIPLSAFGGTHLTGPNTPETQLAPNGHYFFYVDTGSQYAGTRQLSLPESPADLTYIRLSNLCSVSAFATGAGATITPGGSDKINGIAAALDLTDYLVNYRSAVITFTYSSSSANWTVSVLGDLIKPGTVAIYDADKTNTTTLTPVTDLTTNRVITLPDANVDLGKVLSNISYAPTTGVITITNVDATTIATTNTGVIADDMLRIQATGAATKKMGFDASSITAGQTRIVTMPDANVDLRRARYAYVVSDGTFPTTGQMVGLDVGVAVDIYATGSFTLDVDQIVIGVGGSAVTIINKAITNTANTTLTVTPVSGTGGYIQDERGAIITSFTLRTGDSATMHRNGVGVVFRKNDRFSTDSFFIGDSATPSKRLKFNVSAISPQADRTLSVPDADIDLSQVATSSVVPQNTAFVYATGMGSVVKTITGTGTTFNVDALASNRAHSVTIRTNVDTSYPFTTPTTFQFVSAKTGGVVYSGFVDAQGLGFYESYVQNGAPLSITLEVNESIEVRYLGDNGAGGEIFSMQRNLVRLVPIPASTDSFKLYPERKYSLPHAYSNVLNLQLPIVERVGTSITLEDVVGTSSSTITALNITRSGSQTIQGSSSVNIKNLIDNGCTVKLVFAGPSNWVMNVQYSSTIRGNTLGVRNTAGNLTSFNVTAATESRTVTIPDANVDLGNVAQAASFSADGYLTSTDWNTFNGKLGLADVRFAFVSDSGTTYTVPASSVTAAGKTIIELSSSSLTQITVATTTATGKTVGDSVNIRITGTFNAQVLVTGAGVVLEGDLVFYYQYQTKTLVLKNADTNTWTVVG